MVDSDEESTEESLSTSIIMSKVKSQEFVAGILKKKKSHFDMSNIGRLRKSVSFNEHVKIRKFKYVKNGRRGGSGTGCLMGKCSIF